MLEALASLSVAPHPRLSEQEVRERRLALLRRQYHPSSRAGSGRGTRRCARSTRTCTWRSTGSCAASAGCASAASSASTAPPSTAPSQRLFADAPDERACHAIHAAAFGLYGARHLAVPELDADLVSPAESWWHAPFAPVQGYLRRPGSGETAAGRAAPVADGSQAQRLALEEELRRRALVEELLDRLPGDSTRLSSCCPSSTSSPSTCCWTRSGRRSPVARLATPTTARSSSTVFDMGEDRPIASLRGRRRWRAREPGPAGPGRPGERVNEDRLRDARRALLAGPLLPASDPAFGTVRAHRRSACARSSSASWATSWSCVRATRACASARMSCAPTGRPGSPRAGHPDTWQPFTRRHYVLFALALGGVRARPRADQHRAAGRGRALTGRRGGDRARPRQPRRPPLSGRRPALPEHARGARAGGRAGGELGPLARRGRRRAALRRHALGARRPDRGAARGRCRGTRATCCTAASTPPPTRARTSSASTASRAGWSRIPRSISSSSPRRIARTVARGVVLAEWLGLEAERRREGTALIDGDFEPLSDVRFPAARPWTRQVALLLAERICQRVRGGQPRDGLRGPRGGVRRAARALGRGAVRRGAGGDGLPRASRSWRRCGSCAARARTSCRWPRSPASTTST